MKNSLFIVSTPIGNYEDITLRALRVLKEVDFIICEEFKEARRLLSHFKIERFNSARPPAQKTAGLIRERNSM